MLIISQSIHDIQLALTDLILVIEAVVFYAILHRSRFRPSRLLLFTRLAVLFVLITSLSGSLFHLFFSVGTENIVGRVLWSFVIIFMGSMSSLLWLITLELNRVKSYSKNLVLFILLHQFFILYVIYFVTVDFRKIALFNLLPLALLFFVSTRKFITAKHTGYGLISSGAVFSLLSPLAMFIPQSIQNATIAFSSWYHIFQAISFLFIFWGLYKLLKK